MQSDTATGPLHVTVDPREPDSMVRALDQLGVFAIERALLKAGDYRIADRALIERKTAADLAASIGSGRLFRQVSRLATHPRLRPALILEGTDEELAATGFTRPAIQGALISISLTFGVPVLRTLNVEETACTLAYAAQQMRRIAIGALPRHGKRPRGKPALQRFVLQGLAGVGPRRSAALLKHFGTVAAVMGAAEPELADVHGIGADTATRIRWAANETAVHYRVGSKNPAMVVSCRPPLP